jgi:hypothetical protein
VSGSFQDAQFHFANRQLVTVSDGLMRNRGFRLRAKNYLRAGTRRQLAVTADKVRVEVSLDDVLYLKVLRRRFIQILIDIALRIDDDSFAC